MGESGGKSESKQGRNPNKLVDETSTYLLQHAYNPVQWFPWSDEALQKAKGEDKPILLSIGYSACHWCHVMEHESFEDESTAELMNRHFVNIKVDREERPDLDEIYMKCVQLLTGHGGWPMTVFLTPHLKPFFAGTYFPPQDRHGMPSFKRVLLGVKDAWDTRREEVEESSSDITVHLNLLDKVKPGDIDLSEEVLDKAMEPLLRVFDKTWGGFGGAPKFPHTASVSLGMRRMKPGAAQKTSRNLDCMEMVSTTLDRMAWGGMHDQLAGGFARYSVDRKWLIPHFEKMLYDNALIPRNYFDGFLITGNEYWLDVARDVLDFVSRELQMEEGGFYSSLDADSEGEEGKYYVWTPDQIKEVLGQEDGIWFCDVLGVSPGGNFEHGTSALNFPEGPDEARQRFKLSKEDFWNRLNPLRKKLLEAREKRIRPGRDDKMLSSWTSLMISAFVDGYRVLGEQRYLEIAKKAASFILETLYKDGRLLRTYGRGIAKLNGYLDDYAYLIQALLDLAAVDPSARWFTTAKRLNEVVLTHFWSAEDGGFFYTSDDHEELIARTKHFYDGSTPSATSVSVMNLIRLGRLTNNNDYLDMAARTIKLYSPYLHKAPDQFSNLLCALDTYIAKPTEIAIVFNSNKESPEQLNALLFHFFLPTTVSIIADEAAEDFSELVSACPLLQDRKTIDGKPTAYVCRNFACERPTTDLDQFRASLRDIVAQQ